MQEFGTMCTERDTEIVKGVLPYWPRIFCKISLVSIKTLVVYFCYMVFVWSHGDYCIYMLFLVRVMKCMSVLLCRLDHVDLYEVYRKSVFKNWVRITKLFSNHNKYFGNLISLYICCKRLGMNCFIVQGLALTLSCKDLFLSHKKKGKRKTLIYHFTVIHF